MLGRKFEHKHDDSLRALLVVDISKITQPAFSDPRECDGHLILVHRLSLEDSTLRDGL